MKRKYFKTKSVSKWSYNANQTYACFNFLTFKYMFVLKIQKNIC